MASAAFASLVTLPTVITAPGKYITRGGETVQIVAPSGKHDFGCAGTYSCGTPDGWHKSGRLYFGMQSANDIVSAA